MMTIIGVRFRTAGKIYYFDPAGREIKTGDHVIVETARGIEHGYVVLGHRDVDDNKVVPPLKPVIRMATPEDEAVEEPDTDNLSADVIQGMIRELPDGYRTVFNLYVFEEKSHKEIAAMLGITESTSASQFHRAKALLASKIREYRKKHDM